MTILHAIRTRAARNVSPGSTIIDPEGKAEHLLVHSVTRNLGGEAELACYPPNRTEGKRLVRRVKEDADVYELADEQQRGELLVTLAEGGADLAVDPDGRVLQIRWEGGWSSILTSGTPGGAHPEEVPKLDETDGEPEPLTDEPISTVPPAEPEPESLAGPVEDLEPVDEPLAD